VGANVSDANSEGNVISKCACGAMIRGSSDTDLLDAARRHIEAGHPELGGLPPDELQLVGQCGEGNATFGWRKRARRRH